jgi:hypothetical protein
MLHLLKIEPARNIINKARPLIEMDPEEITARIECAVHIAESVMETGDDSFESKIIRETSHRIINQSLDELSWRN